MEAILDIVNEHDALMDWCVCTLTEKFMEGKWLCIPCFIKQEAEAYGRRLQKKIFKWETCEDGSRKLVGTMVCLL